MNSILASVVRARAMLVGGILLAAAACGPGAEAPSEGDQQAASSPAVTPGVAAGPRGVLLVVVDTLRADHVGAFGSELGLTPHLDALADASLVFANTVAASCWTRPSVASIFTGQYPTTLDVLTKQDVLPDAVETLAERLGAAGRRCLGISTNGNAGAAFGFDQGFDEFVYDLPARGYPDGHLLVPAEEVTKRALVMLDALAPDEPFFLFTHYIDPHDPYMPHPSLLDEAEPPGRFGGSRRDLERLDRLPSDERTEDDEARIEWLYAGEVAYCDVARLDFSAIAARGLLDDMLVIVTADHGEGLYDHGKRGHGTDLYDEQVSVPLVVRFPALDSPEPARVERMASHVDIAPTIYGACGLPVPASCQGRDLGRAAREGRLARGGGVAYSEMTFTGIDLEAVSDGVEKLIRNRAFDGEKAEPFDYVVQPGDTLASVSRLHFGRRNHVPDLRAANRGTLPPGFPAQDELEAGKVLRMPARRLPEDGRLEEYYRLDDDPGEQHDLSDVSAAKMSKLRERMDHFAAENRARRVEGDHVALESLAPDLLLELRALGYVGGGG